MGASDKSIAISISQAQKNMGYYLYLLFLEFNSLGGLGVTVLGDGCGSFCGDPRLSLRS